MGLAQRRAPFQGQVEVWKEGGCCSILRVKLFICVHPLAGSLVPTCYIRRHAYRAPAPGMNRARAP